VPAVAAYALGLAAALRRYRPRPSADASPAVGRPVEVGG
jgi:hypothetical protein